MADEPQAKPASESQVEMTEIVNPEDTNPMGTIFGGRVMALMDKAAAVASMRH
ncbi:MAG: hotdog domain-containing protein, partial [Dehalococcoidia bacterium]